MSESDSKKKVSVADQIWDDIQERELPLFAIPGKKVADYCERVDITPSKLFLRLKVTAALPMLEECFGKKYDFQMGTLYCEVSKKDQ